MKINKLVLMYTQSICKKLIVETVDINQITKHSDMDDEIELILKNNYGEEQVEIRNALLIDVKKYLETYLVKNKEYEQRKIALQYLKELEEIESK